MKIPIEKILPNPDQPRKSFPTSELQQLAESMRNSGLVLPIAVEESGDGEYYILQDGERRLRAARLIDWTEIEASISPKSDKKGDRLIRALVANVQRKDLTPSEEGRAYLQLKKKGMSCAAIAHALGTYDMRVHNRIDLLKLDDEILDLVDDGKLPIDKRVIDSFQSINKKEARIKIAQRLARPGVKINTIQWACEKLNQSMTAKEFGETTIPSVELANKRISKKQNEVLPQWDILAQANILPPWEKVCAAAYRSCNQCALRDVATAITCHECPAVELLRDLLEEVNGN